jgi:adenosylmethionine-8-amino-7-oxononanoate transaminase
MTISHAVLSRWDKKHLWHPFTPMAEWEQEDTVVIRSAKGSWLTDTRGRRYLDGVSSLWVTGHGHRDPALDGALRRQLGRVAHSTFLGLTHEPAIALGRELVRVAPAGLTRVFYSDNGATAVEVALKMAFQYWVEKGSPRREFLALRGSYHGDTLGAVSVGGVGTFHKKFAPLLFKARFALAPHCARCPFNRRPAAPRLRGVEKRTPRLPRPGEFRPETGCRWECLKDVEEKLSLPGRPPAGAILEPLVQGAAGMLVQPPGYLRGFAALCRRHGVPLIVDEVATGFGRTGRLFAVEHEGVRPDFLCVAKTLTGGYLPLAATLATEKIYRAFLGRHEEFKTFFHGHSYTANPLACAVARENLRLYRRRRVLARLAPKIRMVTTALGRWSRCPHVGQVRQMGFMAGVELVHDSRTGEPFPVGRRAGRAVCRALRRRGVWLRPLGDTLVILPPLGISRRDLNFLLREVGDALARVKNLV